MTSSVRPPDLRPPTAAPPAPSAADRLREAFDRLPLQLLTLFTVFALLVVFFAVRAPYFLTGENLINLVRQVAPNLLVGVTMTLVITTGGIDLSVGSLVALTGSVAALQMQGGWPWWLATLLALAIGATVGLLHGYVIAVQRIPPFIVTLATFSGLQGLALYFTNGYSIPVTDTTFTSFGQGTIGGFPLPTIVALAVLVLAGVFFRQTAAGIHVTGLGANEEAVRRSGVHVVPLKIWIYVACSVSAAMAGVIVTARLASGSADVGGTFALDVIAAVVLGGTNLFGGDGTLVGTLLGTLIIGMITNALILLHVPPAVTQVAEGAIILGAILLNEKFVQTQGRRRVAARWKKAP